MMRAVGFTEFGGPEVAHRRFEARGVRGRLVLAF